ncbi:CHRD domain-containing protein [Ramlibacter rhizophilus]|uniref:CHRD domain-containing protein n=1 Tax=Ramlibacter rhizophilus TaxID=1781167 RepID=A0A4Z0BK14_9BURK|nr:CHRD domain-containing protein [Ramlibacter rhizophilus]TFY98454.1 CHRD domain-containing protein [Ramlibacter rhizophilus]
MKTYHLAFPALAGAILFGAASTAAAGHLNPVLEAQLDGREEVAANATDRRMVGDPNARAQAYVFGVDGDPRTLCYLIVDVRKLAQTELPPGGGRAAHIHEGARGTNGPVVANLAWPQDGQAADCLTEGETDPSGPKFPTGEPGIVQRILANPSAFYINVHNTDFPAGAIRGQLGEAEHTHGKR